VQRVGTLRNHSSRNSKLLGIDAVGVIVAAAAYLSRRQRRRYGRGKPTASELMARFFFPERSQSMA
jgi:hypothetical protein